MSEREGTSERPTAMPFPLIHSYKMLAEDCKCLVQRRDVFTGDAMEWQEWHVALARNAVLLTSRAVFLFLSWFLGAPENRQDYERKLLL